MLVEMAIGDAYGFGFEMSDKEFVDKFNTLPLSYISQKEDPCHMFKPGVYSDDSQMAISICEAMISGEDWTPLNVAKRFVECFKRDERRGYNGGFFLFLQSIKSGEEFLEKIKPDSEKSGAAMRAMPLGLLRNIDDIRWKNQIQAALTHNTPNGISSAFASALTTHYFYYKMGSKKDLTPWLEETMQCDMHGVWRKKDGDGWVLGERVRVNGWACVEAAIHAIETSNTMTEVLKNCISYCGDVDTVATIALAAASWAKDIEQDLFKLGNITGIEPNPLWEGLENGTFGRDFLSTLEGKLLSCVGGPKHDR